MERTLILIKPDGVQRSLSGEILSRLEKSGLKITGLKLLHVDENLAKEHYAELLRNQEVLLEQQIHSNLPLEL